ncbi:MAG: hypothetical protein KA314_15480 [Chloroflexi bacterium]|nr:hypothetical protein [Chloroflexota bacterium]MBP8057235.1 hypothetical protein [Chloroflexota bacterium]
MGLQAGLIWVAAAGQNRAVGFSPAGDGPSGWSYWGRGRWTKSSRWVLPGEGWAFRLVLLGSRPLDKTLRFFGNLGGWHQMEGLALCLPRMGNHKGCPYPTKPQRTNITL